MKNSYSRRKGRINKNTFRRRIGRHTTNRRRMKRQTIRTRKRKTMKTRKSGRKRKAGMLRTRSQGISPALEAATKAATKAADRRSTRIAEKAAAAAAAAEAAAARLHRERLSEEEINERYEEQFCSPTADVEIDDPLENDENITMNTIEKDMDMKKGEATNYEIPPDKIIHSPIGDVTTLKSPQTGEVVIGSTLDQFADIIISYLRKKLEPQNRDRVHKDNYYNNFMIMLEIRGVFRKNFTDTLNAYFKNAGLDDRNIQPRFDRRGLVDFVNEIVIPGYDIDPTTLRIAFDGKALSDTTTAAAEVNGEKYIPNFRDHNEVSSSEPVNENDKNWIIECITERNNNYIYKYDSSLNKWTLQPKDDKTTILNEIRENNVYTQKCGECWICKQPIYHYYYARDNKTSKEQRTYLNSKCGEDEHVFPPMVGDIIGTLNINPKIMQKTIADFGKATLYSYGLRPSHAFCNQLKNDFSVYGFLNLEPTVMSSLYSRPTKIWKTQVTKWFANKRYHSFEFNTPTSSDADKYFNDTYRNIVSYLTSGISSDINDILIDQAEKGKTSIGNLLKIKLMLYIVQLCCKLNENFKEQWKRSKNYPFRAVGPPRVVAVGPPREPARKKRKQNK